jgi:uncharacterized protein (DUF362 family)
MIVSSRSVVAVRAVNPSTLKYAVKDCLARCEWDTWVGHNSVVVIKPNLCTAVPEKVQASNTDVAVVEALCEALLARTSRIYIGESGHLRQNPWQAFAASGYVDMAHRLGIELVNFSESPSVRVPCSPAPEIAMPRLLLEADAYINVPVLKTHALTYFTGALKNQWGCVPDCRDRLRFHRQINEMLSSLQEMLRPKMVLVDAIVGMEGRGPVNGEPRRLDAILASRDAVAIDTTAMRLVGLDPRKSRHVMRAAERGLGRTAASDIAVEGDFDRLKTNFTPPPPDIANRAMFYASQYDWFVKHVLANDTLYFPIRNLVQLMRRAKLVAR